MYKTLINSIVKMLFTINLLSLANSTTTAQINNLGQPFTTNYTKSDYKGGPQSWDIEYSSKAFIFIANNNGLLVYDGIEWTNCKTRNKTIVRSLALSKSQDKIYVGAQGEFGYFEMIDNKFVYQDLTNLIPDEHSKISDIWEMEEINDTIFFRADNKIFSFFNNHIDVLVIEGTITFIKSINGKLIFNEKEKGVFQVDNLIPKFVGGGQTLLYTEIIDAVQLEDEEYLILTRADGIYFYNGIDFEQWSNNSNEFIKTNLINSGHYFKSKKLICIGTHLGGLAIFDLKGQLQYLFNSETGLQNNTITSIEHDENYNIWLGTYNGIDEVLLTSDDNRFYPDNGLKGAIYDIEKFDGHLYFATSNGLYTIPSKEYYNPFQNTKYELIPGTEGECWGLDLIDNQLFVAHNNGGFLLVTFNTVTKLNLDPGVWKYVKIDNNKIIVGGYSGLAVIENNENRWKFKYKLPGFEESSRILVLDSFNNLWITHPYKGVFKAHSTDGFKTSEIYSIKQSDGITDLNNCYGHELYGKFIVSNESNVFSYNYVKNRFEIQPELDSIFQDTRLLRLIKQKEEYYYISGKNAGRLIENQVSSNYKYSISPIHPNEETFLGGFENLKVISRDQVLICTDKGVLISNMNQQELELKISIKKVLTGPNQIVAYNSFLPDSSDIILPYDQNKIEFQYSSTFSLGVRGKLKYSYRLIGADEKWSDWSNQSYKQFDFLPPNDYTFEVRSLSNGQLISSIDRINFTISPHFLLSTPAIIIYIIIGLYGLFLISMLPRRKILKEKIIADKKVKVLQAENYAIQIQAKDKELAYSTMHLLQKSEFITSLKENISEVQKHIKDLTAKKELKKVISKLQDDQRVEEDWERFSIHFDKVHHDFFKRIKNEFPNLSSKDLKICAYLRLNLTTKEIAPLLGISVRGVEISRYRLRKKMDLDSSLNLNEFMISY